MLLYVQQQLQHCLPLIAFLEQQHHDCQDDRRHYRRYLQYQSDLDYHQLLQLDLLNRCWLHRQQYCRLVYRKRICARYPMHRPGIPLSNTILLCRDCS